jgi:MFS family permease
MPAMRRWFAMRSSQDDPDAASRQSLSGMRLSLFLPLSVVKYTFCMHGRDKGVLTYIAFLRTTDAIAWNKISPYVYFMIKSSGQVDESQIPFWAGVLISVFTFCEFLTGTIWASISDKIGRRRTLLIGSSCGALAAI